FFQAEDGIRVFHVTGVQTCALPIYLDGEKENVDSMMAVAGFSFAGSGQNTGLGFVRLKDWSERSGADQSAAAIAMRATGNFMAQIGRASCRERVERVEVAE